MRMELLHPIFVHFPLALLLTGTVLRAAAFITRRMQIFRFFLATSWLILFIGICFAWLAVITGEIAQDIVGKTLCQPEATDTHSLYAYTAAILFTVALFWDWARALLKQRYEITRLNKVFAVLSFFLFLGAFCILITAGFYGGALVFEQGAAVQKCCSKRTV